MGWIPVVGKRGVFRVLIRRGRGAGPGIRDWPGQSPAVMEINLLLSSNEII